MKIIQENIDRITFTDEGMKEAVADFLAKKNKGTLEKIESYVTNTSSKKLIYRVSVRNGENPNLKIKSIKVLEQGLDHYEIEEDDIKEALQDYVKKYKLGCFVGVVLSNKHVPGDSEEPFDYGHHEYFYEVKLERV